MREEPGALEVIGGLEALLETGGNFSVRNRTFTNTSSENGCCMWSARKRI